MNVKDYCDLYGKEKAWKVAEKAGSNWRYMEQLRRQVRRPSPDLAARLVAASDHELDFVSLLKVEIKQPTPRANKAE